MNLSSVWSSLCCSPLTCRIRVRFVVLTTDLSVVCHSPLTMQEYRSIRFTCNCSFTIIVTEYVKNWFHLTRHVQISPNVPPCQWGTPLGIFYWARELGGRFTTVVDQVRSRAYRRVCSGRHCRRDSRTTRSETSLFPLRLGFAVHFSWLSHEEKKLTLSTQATRALKLGAYRQNSDPLKTCKNNKEKIAACAWRVNTRNQNTYHYKRTTHDQAREN